MASTKTKRHLAKKAKKYVGKYFVEKPGRWPDQVFVGVEVDGHTIVGHHFNNEQRTYHFNPRKIRLATDEEVAKAVFNKISDNDISIWSYKPTYTLARMFKEHYGVKIDQILCDSKSFEEYKKLVDKNTFDIVTYHSFPINEDKP